MSRLIDADALEKIIKMEHCMVINGHLAIRKPSGIYKPLLDEMPTAYDVEKVVAEIKKATFSVDVTCTDCEDVVEIEETIRIIRKGGIE